MAFTTHPSIDEILQVPGYLYLNPTGFTSDKWGTQLGYTETGVSVALNPKYAFLSDDESGEYFSQSVFLGCRPTLSANLFNYNDSVISLLYPGLSASGVVSVPNSLKTGASMSPYICKVLFVPHDLTRDPMVYMASCVPRMPDNYKMLLSHKHKTVFSVVFVALHVSGTTDCLRIGTQAELSA